MAERKKKGGFGGPLKELVASGVMLVVIASALLMVGRSNDIKSIEDAIEYAKVVGADFADCASTLIGRNAEECPWPDDVGPGGGSGGGDGSDDGASGGSGSEEGSSGGSDDNGDSGDSGSGGSESADESVSTLGGVEINDDPADVDYDRSEWKHWTGSPCDTRDEVLKRQGEGVTTGDRCSMESGTWLDPFTGTTTDDSSSLDTDHFVALGYAASHGGNEWGADKKEQFANDMENLRAVDASQNRSKGDDGPSDFMPENEDYHCEYATIWVSVLDKYDLTTTSDDKAALEDALGTC